MVSQQPPDNFNQIDSPSANGGLTPSQQEALATLVVTIERSEGWAMVVGPAGSGKGEIIEHLLPLLDQEVTPVIISARNTRTSMELFRLIAKTLGMPECNYKARFLIDLRAHIEACRRLGRKVLLLVKEAHLLSDDMLQEIELLGNTDQFSPRVLNIVFFARPQILEVLERMGSTNLKHHLRRFRRLEPRTPSEQPAGDRRVATRAHQNIDYSWGTSLKPAAQPAISHGSAHQPASQNGGAGGSEDILEKAFGPSLRPKTLPVLK